MGATPPIPVGSYDFADVVTTVDNQTMLGGVTVKVTRRSDQTTDEVGGNGDVVVSVNNDQRGDIEIELMPSSPSIDVLTQLALEFPNTRRFVTVAVNDLTGRSKANSAQAWVKKIADKDYAAASSNVTFSLVCARLNTTPGGSV